MMLYYLIILNTCCSWEKKIQRYILKLWFTFNHVGGGGEPFEQIYLYSIRMFVHTFCCSRLSGYLPSYKTWSFISTNLILHLSSLRWNAIRIELVRGYEENDEKVKNLQMKLQIEAGQLTVIWAFTQES